MKLRLLAQPSKQALQAEAGCPRLPGNFIIATQLGYFLLRLAQFV
jgi:hypothetical protein